MANRLSGIDVSSWQKNIFWPNVKADGISFAAIKATEGKYGEDPLFAANWQHARNVNIQRIAYHYLDPIFDGRRQAEHFHQYIHNNGKLVLGDAVALDIETVGKQRPATVLQEAEAWVENIKDQTQAGIYIYVGYYFWRDTLGNPKSDILAQCPLWLPSWGELGPAPDAWPTGPAIWQYSSTGRVNGIQGGVDLDYFLGTMAQYKTLARKGGRT